MLELGGMCFQCRIVKMNFFDKCAKERKRERWSFSINVQANFNSEHY